MAGKNKTLGGGGFHHVAIRVADFDKSLVLYRDVLGFVEKITWGQKDPGADSRAVMLDTGDGNYLEIFAGGTGKLPGEGAMLHMAFRTVDVDACAAPARAAGLAVTMEPQNLTIPSLPRPTPVRIAFCKGYDGEVIEFFQNDVT